MRNWLETDLTQSMFSGAQQMLFANQICQQGDFYITFTFWPDDGIWGHCDYNSANHQTGIPVPQCMLEKNETMRLWSLLSITHSSFRAGEAPELRASDFMNSPFKHNLTPQMKEHTTAGWKQEIQTQQWRANDIKVQRKASSEMNDVSKDLEKTIWGGENCLLLLNEDVNNLFQLEDFKAP